MFLEYSSDNVFAKILRGELPCKRIYENDAALAFHNIAPKAPVHALVIPKLPAITFSDFAEQASNTEILGFVTAIQEVIKLLDLRTGGYKLIANNGGNARQEVPHFHMHIMGGKVIDW